MKKWYWIVLLVLFLFVSCRAVEIEQPEPTATAQAMEILVPTSTATALPTSTTTPASTSTPEGCPTWDYDTEVPDPDFPKNYIGMHLNFRDLPGDMEWSGVRIIRDGHPEYSHELIWTHAGWKDNREINFLQKFICHDESGKSYSVVVDAFATPVLTGEEFTGACFNGNTKLDAVGFGYFDDSITILIGDYYGYPSTEIIYLYYVDFEAEKFVFLDADDFDELICIEDPGPGPNH